MKKISAVFIITALTTTILYLKEVRDMAAIYVALIIKGKRTFASVPVTIKAKVREMLIDLELEDLITEA